jgi:hypothetical protein
MTRSHNSVDLSDSSGIEIMWWKERTETPVPMNNTSNAESDREPPVASLESAASDDSDRDSPPRMLTILFETLEQRSLRATYRVRLLPLNVTGLMDQPDDMIQNICRKMRTTARGCGVSMNTAAGVGSLSRWSQGPCKSFNRANSTIVAGRAKKCLKRERRQ